MLITTNPATGAVIRETQPMSDTDLAHTIRQATAAQQDWAARSFEERGDVLRAVAKHLRDHVETLAPLMTEEMGKPIREARGEVAKAAWCAEHYAEHAAAYLATETITSDAHHSYVQHLPLGTVLGILPWNAPFWLASRFFAPALMAGNTCLLKHDPHVQACASAIEDVFHQAGAPEGILLNLPIANSQVESAIRHPDVRAVSFTGSSAAGAKVAAVAASEIKPAVLELGGSDPSIVLADADLDAAAATLCTSRIINAGQSCIAAKRIIVEDRVHDDFVERLRQRLAALKVGAPHLEDTDVGPIAREDLRHNLHRQVMETCAAGAQCLLGGELPDGPGYFYPVTLLTGVGNDMTACREETFGPVAVVLRAADEEEALQIANDCDYGLAGSVWTETARGEALARRMITGQVSVNGIVKTDPRLPSGGVRRSGYGRELGPHGIRAFVNVQQVWVGPAQT